MLNAGTSNVKPTIALAKKALRRKLKYLPGEQKIADLERVVTETLRYFTDASGHTHNPVQQPWMVQTGDGVCVCVLTAFDS